MNLRTGQNGVLCARQWTAKEQVKGIISGTNMDMPMRNRRTESVSKRVDQTAAAGSNC